MKTVIVFVLQGKETLNLDIAAKVREAGSSEEIIVRGIVADEAKAEIRAVLEFLRGCKGATGKIDLDVTTLSSEAAVRLEPVILSGENTATGQHGAVSGRFDAKTLMYLGSRGYRPKRAREELTRAKLWGAIGMISDDSERNVAYEVIGRRLNDLF